LNFCDIVVNPTNMGLHFQENSGVLFTITDMNFTGKLEQNIYFYTYINTFNLRVSLTVRVDQNQNQHGHLKAYILKCEFRIENEDSSGSLGWLWGSLSWLIKTAFNNKACSVLLAKKINSMLKSISTEMKLEDNYNFTISYALSEKIRVTSTSIDVPFKGLVFRQGESINGSLIKSGSNPVWSDANWMAYICISEFLFNSAAMSLYESGPFLLKDLEGPVIMNLTAAPTIRITGNGLAVNAEGTALSVDRGNLSRVETCSTASIERFHGDGPANRPGY
ncbi:PREDICTED: uncharacterized protein LOC107104755, partial [Cyprinodon variegatus]|uniref:uncharacterized protein LOC107104755 n=1 Tax=Cyprinodon variegatus TaxID=28743 RepID=UPI00074258DA